MTLQLAPSSMPVSIENDSSILNTPPRTEWIQQIGTNRQEFGRAGVELNSAGGGVFIGGYTSGNFQSNEYRDEDLWIAWYDSAGRYQWLGMSGFNTDEISLNSSVQRLASDRSGNVFIAGEANRFDSFSGFEVVVQRWSPSGGIQWTQRIPSLADDYLGNIATDQQDNLYVVGWTRGAVNGIPPNPSVGEQVFVAKYNPTGSLQWMRPISEPRIGRFNYDLHIAVDSNGDYYVTGYVFNRFGETSIQGPDAWLGKYNADGILQWSQEVEGESGEYSTGLALDPQGNAYLIGTTSGSVEGVNLGQEDSWVAKFDPSGERQWIRQFGTPLGDRAFAVDVDPAGNVYISGETSGSFGAPNKGAQDAFVIKYDTNGNQRWVWQDGTNFSERAYGVKADGQGNVYVSGEAWGGTLGEFAFGGTDLWVAKLIDSDRSAPSIEFEDASVTIPGDAGAFTPIAFDITLSEAPEEDITLEYFTLDLSADQKDYVGISSSQRSSVTFTKDGDPSQRIFIQVLGEESLNHVELEFFATDTVFREWDKRKNVTDFPFLNNDPRQNDYWVDRVFKDPTTGLDAAVGLTSDESFLVIITDPENKSLRIDDPALIQKQVNFLIKLTEQYGGNSPIVQRVTATFKELNESGKGWTFSTGTIYQEDAPPVMVFGYPTRLESLGVNAMRELFGNGTNFGYLVNGYNQFNANKEILSSWLQESSSANGDRPATESVIVGQGYGGALAQWLGTYYTSTLDPNTNAPRNSLGQLVTFNSPGIPRNWADQFNAAAGTQVTHYINSGDIASLTGEALINGNYLLFDYGIDNEFLFGNLIDRFHRQKVLSSLKPPDLVLKGQGQVQDLTGPNQPLFNFVDDPDYFAFLLYINKRFATHDVVYDLTNREKINANLDNLRRIFSQLDDDDDISTHPDIVEARKAVQTLRSRPSVIGIFQQMTRPWEILSKSVTVEFWREAATWDERKWNLLVDLIANAPGDLWAFWGLVLEEMVNDLSQVSELVRNQFIAALSDSNQDGIPDGLQPNVIAMVAANNIRSFLSIISTPGTRITRNPADPPGATPPNTETPLGNQNFQIELGQNPESQLLLAENQIGEVFNAADAQIVVVDIQLQPDLQSPDYNSYWLYGSQSENPTPEWYNFTFDGETGTQLLDTDSDGDIDLVKLHLIDGGRGDNDGQVNGVIQVTGAIGITQNQAPVVQPDKTLTLEEDAPATPLSITTPTDADGDTLTITVTELPDASRGNIRLANGSPVALNQILTADELTGLMYVPVTNANGDAGTFTYSVSDPQGGVATQTVTLAITPVNDAPIVQNAITDQTAIAGQPFTFTIPETTFTDVDGDNLTYNATLPNGDPLPNWLNFDPTARTFQGTPPAEGTLAIEVTATDTAQASISDSFPLTVANLEPTTNLDIDGNGTLDALTDGLICLGYLFGAPAEQLAGFVGEGANHTTGDQLLNYLKAKEDTMLDPDGNNTPDALTDGLIILGYLFGAPAEQLAGFVGEGATRTTGKQLQEFFATYQNPTPAALSASASSYGNEPFPIMAEDSIASLVSEGIFNFYS